jgi:hypothetical protein
MSDNPDRIDDPAALVTTARRHLCDAEEKQETKLPSNPLDPPDAKSVQAEDELEEQVIIRQHFLAACEIVLVLMERGAFPEARAVQANITEWVKCQSWCAGDEA